MSAAVALITATFTTPENIGTDPTSVLWLLPLAAAIAVVYKATKVSKIKARSFAKESAVLFGSIIVFMAATAVVLCAVEWLIIE